MRILVAVKQVPDPEAQVGVDADGRRPAFPYPPRYLLNQFDEFAIEEGVRIKQANPGVVLDVLSIGPERVKAVLERCLGMGADNAVWIESDPADWLPPLSVAGLIAAYVGRTPYELIITGVMAEDDMQAQVGPMLAALLGWPSATSVIRVAPNLAEGVFEVEREVEGGRRISLKISGPCVLAVQSGINKPRYPTLSGLLRAKKQTPLRLAAADLEVGPVREGLATLGFPRKSRAGLTLEGEAREKARRLVGILKEKALLA